MPRIRPDSRPLRVALASTVLLACALGAPAPTLGAPPDPVFVAINRAAAAGHVTPLQAVQLRATWKMSAHAARNAPSASRRANVMAVRTYTTNLARRGGLGAARLEPALLSVKATSWAMRYRADFPSHEEEVEVPGEAVAFTYYSGRGVQFQPFETFKEGNRALNRDVPDAERARAIADRMLELDVPRGNSTTWEYYFPFGGPSRPWTSSISQATATEFFARVAALVPEAERAPYLEAAAAANRSFLRPTGAGGVAVAQGTGRFYVMYPFAPAQRILNGHLQVLLNVSRYAKLTSSPEAAQVLDLGTKAVLPMLPKFDSGAWSYYLPGQEADLGYHEFQTSQLVRLGTETGNPVFREYGERFTSYLTTPPTVTLDATTWPSIIPARDGFRDAAVVRFAIDKRSRVTMVVRDAAGAEVWRSSWRGARGRGSIAWFGRDSRGRAVPDGDYVATLTSTDAAGNRALDELPSHLRVEHDRIAPQVSTFTVAEAAGTGVVTLRARDLGSAWIVASIRVHGRTIATRRGPRDGSITLRTRRPIGEVLEGQLLVRDSSGNTVTFEL